MTTEAFASFSDTAIMFAGIVYVLALCAHVAEWVVALTAPAVAQNAPAFTPDAFRAHVTFLADNLLEGRDAGSRGYEIAARYVASRFEALGHTSGRMEVGPIPERGVEYPATLDLRRHLPGDR